MMTSDNCPWCKLPSNYFDRLCRQCGHEAHVAQPFCECIACLSSRPKYKAFTFTTPPVYDLADTQQYLVGAGLARRAATGKLTHGIPAV